MTVSTGGSKTARFASNPDSSGANLLRSHMADIEEMKESKPSIDSGKLQCKCSSGPPSGIKDGICPRCQSPLISPLYKEQVSINNRFGSNLLLYR